MIGRLPLLFVVVIGHLHLHALLLGKGESINTATFLYCIERDDYTDKRYVD
jgi:hypothetical protein